MGNSLLPFGDGLPHHIQLVGKVLLGKALGFPKGFDVFIEHIGSLLSAPL